jgi:hypothetical protein
MAWMAENSRIRVDAALEEKINGASAEEIKEIMKSAAVEQGLVKRDWDPQLFIETPLGTAAPKRFAKAVVVNGVKTVLEGDSEQSLLAAETAFYRQQFQPVATETRSEQPRNEHGQFISADDAAAKAELELAFKRGDISAAEYLDRSGAISEYLEKAGVPVEELKTQVAERQEETSVEMPQVIPTFFQSLIYPP